MSFRISVLALALLLTQTVVELCAEQLLVSDRLGNRVLVFNPTTGAYQSTLISGINKPTSLAIIPGVTGTELLVGSTEGGTIGRYNPASGAFLGTFANVGVGDIYYHAGSNSVLVADFGGTGVRRYQPNGTFVDSFGAGIGAFSGLDIDSNGNLLVSSYFGGVYQFNPTTGSQIGMGSIVSYNGQGAGVAGIKVLPSGDFLTSNDFLSGGLEIARFNAAGTLQSPTPFIDIYNPANPTLGGTAYTNGMTILNNKLLVANQGNNNPNDGYFGMNLFNGSVGQYTLSGSFESNFITMPDTFGPTDFAVSPVPEPGTWGVLVLAATGGIMFYRRRRQTAN
jgi:hypothetical protein